MKIFMKYFLLIFIFVFSNQIWSQDIVINFGKEIKTAQTAEIYKNFLDKYFNDKCKIKINETEIILKEKNFQNYANVAAKFAPKIDKDFDIKIKDEKELDDNEIFVESFVKISEQKILNVNCVIKNQKFSEIIFENLQLSLRQKLTLSLIVNLLRS